MESKQPKILMVGAGGIGCELIKNLVLSGLTNVEIVDLDTIGIIYLTTDLSNLNRQFLFQQQHIKKPKATIAAQSALKFNSKANLVSHYCSIFDAKFSLDWFQGFDIVLNGF